MLYTSTVSDTQQQVGDFVIQSAHLSLPLLNRAYINLAEHLFQSLKFLPQRPDIATKVRKASSPSDAIREARKNIADVKRGWIGKGLNVSAMREVLLLKFSQHSTLRRQLLLTGDSEIVEASPTDAFWGNASGGGRIALGRNELGKALQRTRETISAQAGLGIGSGAKTV